MRAKSERVADTQLVQYRAGFWTGQGKLAGARPSAPFAHNWLARVPDMAGTALLAPARCGGRAAQREGGAPGPARPHAARKEAARPVQHASPPRGGRLPSAARERAARPARRGLPVGARALVSDSAQFFRLCDRFMPREARNSVNQAEEPHGGHRRSGKTPSSTIRRVAKSKKLCRNGARPPPVSPPSGEQAVGGGLLLQNRGPTPARPPPSGARPLPYSASPNRPQVNRKSSDLGEPPTCARMSPWARRNTAKADPGSAGASRMAA